MLVNKQGALFTQKKNEFDCEMMMSVFDRDLIVNDGKIESI